MSREPGIRVGAISHSEGNTIYLFGFGVYEGEAIPETAGGFMGEALRNAGIPNPKIVLDNGKVVWGCECWWGPEAEIQQKIQGHEVVDVDIDKSRAESVEPEPVQDQEYVEIISSIEGEYPGLEALKEALKSCLHSMVGAKAEIVVPAAIDEILQTLALLHFGGSITSVTEISVSYENEELEAVVGLMLPGDKKVSLTLVLKKTTTEAI